MAAEGETDYLWATQVYLFDWFRVILRQPGVKGMEVQLKESLNRSWIDILLPKTGCFFVANRRDSWLLPATCPSNQRIFINNPYHPELVQRLLNSPA